MSEIRYFEITSAALRSAGRAWPAKRRLAGLGLVGVWLFLGLDIDRGAVIGGADAAGEKGAVVAGIVPGEGALVAGILPQADGELHRLDRFLAVEHDGLAVGLDLLAA